MLKIRQEEGVGGSCACRQARGERRGELCLPLGKRRKKGELYLPSGKRREKQGVVFVR